MLKVTSKKAVIAFCTLGTVVSTAVGYSLNSAKWAGGQATFYVNPVSQEVSPDMVIAALQRGAEAWSRDSHANFRYIYGGTTSSTTVSNNGHNDVFFRNATASSGSSTIATTYTWWDGSSRLIDSDMVFWDGSFRFYAGTSGCSGGQYIEDVATHEFGHMLGLGHSSVSGATMYPSISSCSQAGRTLASDDIAGVEKLYPPVTTGTPTPTPTPAPTTTLPSVPSYPVPAHLSTSVSIYADLDWSSSARVTSYNVYFGTSSTPPLYRTGLTSSSLSLPTLNRSTTYYWRVVAKNSSGSVSSSVWRFTTRSY